MNIKTSSYRIFRLIEIIDFMKEKITLLKVKTVEMLNICKETESHGISKIEWS